MDKQNKHAIAELSVAIDNQGIANLLRGHVRCICPFSTPVQTLAQSKIAGAGPEMIISPRFCDSMCPLMQVKPIEKSEPDSELVGIEVTLNCGIGEKHNLPFYQPPSNTSPGGILLN